MKIRVREGQDNYKSLFIAHRDNQPVAVATKSGKKLARVVGRELVAGGERPTYEYELEVTP